MEISKPNLPHITTSLENYAPSKEAQKELADLKKATADLESFFAKELFKKMRSIQIESGSEGQWKEFCWDNYEQAIANDIGGSAQLGFAKLLYKGLSEAIIAQDRAKFLKQYESSGAKKTE